jgi:hypothetical protein
MQPGHGKPEKDQCMQVQKHNSPDTAIITITGGELIFVSVGLRQQKQHASNAQQIMKQLPAHFATVVTTTQW